MGIDPQRVIKLSGIGCSSKSPAYFLNTSHAFNAVHGRMPSVATGAMLANHKLIALGVTGDGDTASIGIGQFVHLMRRNLPIIYVIEDNGCYGLTKGQFSATADLGSTAEDRRGERLATHRHLLVGDRTRSDFRGAIFLGCQEAVAEHPQGRSVA